MNNAPQRTYFLSDTYGGSDDWNPLALPDPDVLISTDYGGRPAQPVHREFDIFGQEDVAAHVLQLVLSQHDELLQRTDLTDDQRQAAIGLGTGIFINSAPRTARNNAEPFYLATARGGAIRIVTTPLAALSAVRDQIETLQHLPNPTDPKGWNGLYTGREQFRSRLTPRLLHPNHGLTLEKDSPSDIPKARRDWHISYVDRFGNVVTRTENPDAQWAAIESATKAEGDRLRLLLGEHLTGPLEITTSLGEATPGAPSVYKNSGGIDVVVKWVPNQTASERLASSAWNALGRPKIGTPIKLPA
jgi:hypothetical protein